MNKPQDSTHSILISAKRFFGGTMLSRISGLLRDVAMAFAFGTQEAVAAFLVAFRFAHLLRRLFGEGALQTAFIPQYESLRKQQPERAAFFFRDLVIYLSLGLSILIALAMGIIGACLFFFDFSEGNREILFLTFLLMPSLLFICLFGLNAAFLQCEKSYFTPGVAPVAFNIIWIIGVLVLRHTHEKEAMIWLTGWVILACFSQWAMTIPRAYTLLKNHAITKPWQNIHWKSTDLKLLFKPLLLGILGVAATQVNNAVDTIFARYADGEGPALLWYALRIQQLPLALFGVAIAGALMPPLTRSIKNNQQADYRQFLEFAIRRCIAFMLPITAALFILGDSCINLIYGRGDFSDLSIFGTTQCLWGYNAGLIPMTLVLILAPAFYAQGNPRVPAMASVVVMVLNMILNSWMIAGLGFGAASVALATSISAWVNFALLAAALPEFSIIASKECWQSAIKVLIACGVAINFVFIIDFSFFEESTALLTLQGTVPVFSHNFVAQLSRLAIQSVTFISALIGMAWMLKANDLLFLFKNPKPNHA